MALSDTAAAKTLKATAETAATETVLTRTLVTDADNGGVFPNYGVRCTYATATFIVDDSGNRLQVISQNMHPQTVLLSAEDLYSFYLIPVTATVNSQSVTTNLGELLCSQIDALIQGHRLDSVIASNPASQEVAEGDTVYLTVRVNDSALLYVDYSIAWFQDGVVVAGQTSEEFSFVASSSNTSILAKVTTPFGVATSTAAQITITKAEA